MSLENVDSRLLTRCLRCGEMVARTDIGVDGVCRACKTTHKKTNWQASEERRLEKAEMHVKAPIIICPRCKKRHEMTEDSKRCDCGYFLKKNFVTYS